MTTNCPLRLLVVHGAQGFREALARALVRFPTISVVGWAMTGRAAILKLASYRPDVVLLDFDEQPGDAIEVLAYLRHNALPVRRLGLASEQVSADTLEQAALLGGVERIRRPPGTLSAAELAWLVGVVPTSLLRLAPAGSTPVVASSGPRSVADLGAVALPPAIVGIGVSTGGPTALMQLLPMLPADFPLPIVLVQHMPPKFTQGLAESLDRACGLRVREAKTGDRVERGRILVAPGGHQMRIAVGEAGGVVRITDDPPECSCRPSVDYLFRSLNEVHRGRVLAVMLTGMGEDGWIGSRLVHRSGGRVLAQDEATSAVFSMPRGPIEAGIAPAVPLPRMADAILQCVRGAALA